MKHFYLIIFLLAVNFSASSTVTDTCNYIHLNNDIGGLDCFMGSVAPFTADSYQWLDCDNSFAPIAGDTLDWYQGVGSVNIALEIHYLGCVDTSMCYYVCTWGLEELYSNKVELVTILDLMGRESQDKPNVILIYVYSDGTTEKVFKLE